MIRANRVYLEKQPFFRIYLVAHVYNNIIRVVPRASPYVLQSVIHRPTLISTMRAGIVMSIAYLRIHVIPLNSLVQM